MKLISHVDLLLRPDSQAMKSFLTIEYATMMSEQKPYITKDNHSVSAAVMGLVKTQYLNFFNGGPAVSGAVGARGSNLQPWPHDI